MAIQAERSSWKFVALLALAFVVWLVQQFKPELLDLGREPQAGSSERTKVSDYEEIAGVRWVDYGGNDGDSFRLKLPDGRVETFRIYYVDDPESEFREYRNGETNHQRIREQAEYFGITPERAVEIGQQAKHEVRDVLDGRKLRIWTKWEDPFGDRRYRALIEVPGEAGLWLHEWLVDRGLGRIHTRGAELPDGTSRREQERRLRERERVAKEAGRGAWGR